MEPAFVYWYMEKIDFVIRKAVREDTALIFEFIKGIAKYEKMDNEVEATVEILEEQLFDKCRAEVIFCCRRWQGGGVCTFLP